MANNNNVPEEVWRRKDLLSARQTAIRAAAIVYEGQAADSQHVLAYADKFFNWIWQGQPEPETIAAKDEAVEKVEKWLKNTDVPNGAAKLPDAQRQQLHVLKILYERIAEKYNSPVDRVKVRRIVLAKYGRYPQLEQSVDKIMAECDFRAALLQDGEAETKII